MTTPGDQVAIRYADGVYDPASSLWHARNEVAAIRRDIAAGEVDPADYEGMEIVRLNPAAGWQPVPEDETAEPPPAGPMRDPLDISPHDRNGVVLAGLDRDRLDMPEVVEA